MDPSRSIVERLGLRVGADRTAAWLIVLALGLAAIAAYYELPQAGAGQAVVLPVVNASAIVAGLVAARRARALSRLVWIALAAGMSLSTFASIPSYAYPLITHRDRPFPSVGDALWLLTYPCFVVALWGLQKQRRGDDNTGNLIDALIVTIGGGMLLWTFVLGPNLDEPGLPLATHIVSLGYPVMDVAVFAMLVRLLVGTRHNAAMHLLTASFVALLAADTLDTVQTSNGTYALGGPCDGLWMLSYLLIAVAALHPTARAFPAIRGQLTYRITLERLAFLSAALLVGPIVLTTRSDDRPWLVTLSAISFGLVIVRMTWINCRLVRAQQDVDGMADVLRHQALHDALTQLPNRTLILDRMEQLQTRMRRNGTQGAALFVDVDGFKTINDTLGHAVGDLLLQSVAARLTAALRDADTIGRLGGDEFVILVEQPPDAGGAEWVAQRILDVAAAPFELAEVEAPLRITVSVGIASARCESAADLLRNADVALYQAKAAGKNCYEVFHPAMETAVSRRYNLERALHEALDAGQYRLLYQPIYDLENFALIGFEALLRWHSPTHGVVSPSEFVPILEASGQIADVGRWVLGEACRQMAAWQRATARPLAVSVNVAAHQLDRDAIVAHVRDALRSSGLQQGALTIEVTETALMRDVEASARRLHELKGIGVRIAIDDFGTGYSSLAYLQRFPVDCLKIDRGFIESIARSPEGDALVHALVQLGKVLGLQTLAEGVETERQVARLRAEEVDAVQGFLFAHPLTPEAIEQVLGI